MRTPLPTTGMKQCGSCTACCSVFEIQEIGKPKDVPCEHLCKEGCGIHKSRPNQCRAFYCSWLQGHVFNGKLSYRPDKLGLIFTYMALPPLEGVIGVYRVSKRSLSPKAKGLLREMARTLLFFFEGSLYGKQELINAWLGNYGKRLASGELNGSTITSVSGIRAGSLPEL